MYLSIELFLFTIGYVATTLAYYINHRFIFHGRLPIWVPRIIRRTHQWYSGFHMRHHIFAFPEETSVEEVKEYLTIPTLAKLLMLSGLIITSYVSAGLALGIATFFIMYGIRHGRIHGMYVPGFKPIDKNSIHYQHHMLHHSRGNWSKFNFSGVHPWVDKLFKTYSNPLPYDKKSESSLRY